MPSLGVKLAMNCPPSYGDQSSTRTGQQESLIPLSRWQLAQPVSASKCPCRPGPRRRRHPPGLLSRRRCPGLRGWPWDISFQHGGPDLCYPRDDRDVLVLRQPRRRNRHHQLHRAVRTGGVGERDSGDLIEAGKRSARLRDIARYFDRSARAEVAELDGKRDSAVIHEPDRSHPRVNVRLVPVNHA